VRQVDSNLLNGFLTKDATAAVLRIRPRTLDTWASRAYGPARIKFGHTILYREAAVRSWLAELERAPLGRAAMAA
jgi:hypothetical protein